MKEPIFTGTSVAIVTPFKSDGRIDFDKFKELVEFHAENGTNSITVAGTTGECSTLTDDEQIELIEKCVEYVDGRMTVIAGSGSNDTMHGIKLSRAAEKAGADALLVVTPYYNKTTQNGLVKHYMQIADSVNIPMVLYSVPSRTGMTIGVDALQKLSEHPMINGLKDANSNFEQLLATIHACGEKLNIWCGNDTEIVPMMALGVKGVISVWANIDPKAVLRVTDACMNGDYATAAKFQADAYELLKALFIETNPIPVKTAMNLMGFDVGGLRMPLCEMGDQNKEILKNALLEKGLIQ